MSYPIQNCDGVPNKAKRMKLLQNIHNINIDIEFLQIDLDTNQTNYSLGLPQQTMPTKYLESQMN